MARTGGKWEGDLPFTDGKIICCPGVDIVNDANATLTRNAQYDWSYNVGAAVTARFLCSVSSNLLERVGMADDSALLENFGTSTPGNSAGTGVVAYTGNQGGPYQVSGRPPFTGSSQLTPPVGFRAKGIKLIDVTMIYLITGAGLGAHTIGVAKIPYANNIAIVPVNVLASGANGLQVATQANPYLTKVTIPVNSQFFNVTDNQEIVCEVVATTGGGGAYRLYRVEFHVQYNWA